ncbi:MAG TPA: DUF4157 domain-containing protein, partial [Kofleriaceae bacterium]|nr:DUF4157 domain-containing protein [Kofleriaceae bacterium]
MQQLRGAETGALLDLEEQGEEQLRPRIAPGRRTRSERLPVQRKALAGDAAAGAPRSEAWAAARGLEPFEVHVAPPRARPAGATEVSEVAARGVDGTGGPLPFADTIQRAFGHHAIGGVRAHTDGAAAGAARAIGARAYATGDDVAFGGAPDLHTAAHEAAHVVQQRA